MAGNVSQAALVLVEDGESAEKAGELARARQLYLQAIRTDPACAPAHIGLGIVLQVGGDQAAALESFSDALRADPRSAPAHYNVGLIHLARGHLVAAETDLRAAIELRPAFPEAQVALAETLERSGRLDQAIDSLRKAVEDRSDYFGALDNLFALLEKAQRFAEAAQVSGRLVELAPESASAHFKLATALHGLRDFSGSEAAYRRTIELQADFTSAINGLATAIILQDPNRVGEAEMLYRRAIAEDPSYVLAHHNLGSILQGAGRLSEAELCFRRALELDPRFRQAHVCLGDTLKDLGYVDEAIKCLRKALDLNPLDRIAHDSLLMTLNYAQDISREQLFLEHTAWAGKFEAPPSAVASQHSNSRVRSRRLRIGYVSPDFRRHSVAYFIEPLLSQHDRGDFEVFCYSNVAAPDATTRRLLALADKARSIVDLDTEEIAAMVQDDGIDILVDLAGHTAGNSLQVFTLRPAPVQVTYLGYPNSTGLRSVDWRITDAHADPVGEGAEFHSERLERVIPGFLCFQPPGIAPAVAPAPVMKNGYVTFGSFNALPKITTEVLATWAAILARVPGSRLLLKSFGLADARAKARIIDEFSGHGIGEERLSLLPPEHSLAGHLGRYSEIDVGLDPFPFNGTTTTMEALWMGLPVIAVKGDRHAARVSASILLNIGLDELIAESPGGSVRLAEELASDRQRIVRLRSELRDRIACSALCDKAIAVKAIEAAYRRMWERWCADSGR